MHDKTCFSYPVNKMQLKTATDKITPFYGQPYVPKLNSNFSRSSHITVYSLLSWAGYALGFFPWIFYNVNENAVAVILPWRVSIFRERQWRSESSRRCRQGWKWERWPRWQWTVLRLTGGQYVGSLVPAGSADTSLPRCTTEDDSSGYLHRCKQNNRR